MGNRRATYRLLTHSSKPLFNRRWNPFSQSQILLRPASGFRNCFDENYRGFQPSVESQKKSFLSCLRLLRDHRGTIGSGIGIGNGIQHRCYGSMAGLVKRNPAFSELNAEDIRYFEGILGEKNVIQDDERLMTANTDWMRKYKGSSKLMLLPKSTEEVSQILKYCNSRCLAVVPQGGNTGLVGGSVPVFDEVIINLSSMNNIISFDKVSGILVCEAGCILENLIAFLDNEGFIMPLDLGAKGSCQIGGNISTNAGGLRLLRYGSLHGTVLGLEAVLANGNVLDILGTLRKDNTGYDLKHLFIGSEGSLGIVTKVSILTPPKLSSVNVAFLACKDYDSCQFQRLISGILDGSLSLLVYVSVVLSGILLSSFRFRIRLIILRLLQDAKRKLGEILSAFEFLDSQAMDLVLHHLEGVRNPLPPSRHNFYLLIETTGSDESNDKQKLEAFLLRSLENGLISDGVLAQDINQASSFWRIREGIPEALLKAGAVYKYDLSIPVEKMYNLVEEMQDRLGNVAKTVAYGHLGDGNLHLNVSSPQYDDKILAQIEPFVYEWTSKYRGSISAEHGLGLMKANEILYSKSVETVQLMASIKKLLDPREILNPYKVLPQSLISAC
ncbi:D-2-hydroxyglutarate dehydrogenase, mitochondrial-like [Quillaja saponaria]|uniref:D-2-hydroxyglutarate dehydrogenase n=1 Tax=Quillaja saponaria TaxID=32244 RepID=A0AAD7KQL8_QUISA|nr:D-2-hydroxyglutarate dehydrogenase, mitochondrial-like [Quillaja saponaria]